MSPFKSATEQAIQFEHTMSTLKSISQMDLIKNGDLRQAESNMARLTAQAKELGATTIYTAQQIGEAQIYVARTGWDTNAIEKSMPSILKLAAALSAVVVAGAGVALAAAGFSYVSSGIMLAVGAVRTVIAAFSAARAAVMGFGAVSAIAGAVATAPIWAIAAAVIGVIGIIGYATGAFDGLGDAIANAWNHPQGAITGFCELVKSSIDGAVNYVVNRWNTLRSALAHPLDAVINFIDHGDVIGGNVKSGEQQAQERAINSAHRVASGGNFGGGGANFDGTVDTTALQTAVNETTNSFAQVPPPAYDLTNSLNMATPVTQNIMNAAQATQFNMDGLNAVTENL